MKAESRSSSPICIAVHQGFSVRYMLQTDILPRLIERGASVVVIAPAAECGYVRAVVPASVRVLPTPVPAKPGRLQRYLRTMRHVLHGEYSSTAHEIYSRILSAAPTSRNRLQLRLLQNLAAVLSMARPLRRAVPRLEAMFDDTQEFRALLRSIAPKLVVVTSAGAFGQDAQIVRAANSLRLPVTTVILSWDNTSSTGYPAAFGNYAIAWTSTMKEELVRFLDYRPEQVAVCGVAHFDRYHRPDPGFDRNTILAGLGLDPARQTILLATKSPNSFLCNGAISEVLAKAIADGQIPNAQLVIRVHPIHYRRSSAGALTYAAVLDDYKRIAQQWAHVAVSEPTVAGESPGHVMGDDEMTFVVRLMRAADVLVNMFSTMNIEGALLDKPLVNVCFELTEVMPAWAHNPERFDIRSDAAEHHNMRIIDSGGTRVAYTPQELCEHVSAYLANPSLDADARRRIAAHEGGPFRGTAGRVIADHIVHSSESTRRLAQRVTRAAALGERL